MSSTNRGADRNKDDFYITPIEPVIHFLHELVSDIPHITSAKRILDPAAGGLIGEQNIAIKDKTFTIKDAPMTYPAALAAIKLKEFTNAYVDTADIRSDSRACYHVDYLTWTPPVQPDVVITNPPFFLAIEFIRKALCDVLPGGHVIMLARLNFFGSAKRRKFWKETMPVYTYVHSERMGFTPDGKTDSIEYAHFVWQRGIYPRSTHPRFTQLRVI